MTHMPDSDRLDTTERLVVACFVLSGLAALMYQTAWMRLFSITFGTSELAVATVLSAYMAGLALGAALVSRIADRIERPVRVYAALEGGIAITALLVPALLWLAGKLLVQLLGLQPAPPDSGDFGQTAFYLGATFVIVGIPTALMGATMPVLARYLVHRNRHIGPRMGLIYGMNTAGAVLGVVLGSFVLLPRVGLDGVVYTAVAINALIFVIAMRLPVSAAAGVQPQQADAAAGRGARAWILPIMLLSGSVSFVYEVLWTRLLGHVIGSSVYAFATMLATFLAGIALGGSLGGAVVRYFRHAGTPFVIAQAATALFSMLTYYALDAWLAGAAGLGNQVGIAMAVMLPSTLFIGATYPIAVRIYTRTSEEIGAASARVYAWNTVGAIAGAVLAGFVILPGFGFQGAVRIAVVTNLLLGFAAFVLIARPRLPAGAAGAVVLLLVAVFYQPARPAAVMSSTAFEFVDPPGATEEYYAVGRASTVYLTQANAYFDLRTNGLPEAQIYYRGTVPFRNTQRWLGILPLLARPEADSMLIVGLGGGIAVEGVPPTVDDVDVVELEHEVLVANEVVADRRAVDPLADPRVTVVINDARSALTLTDRHYDAIVSQPSHPWTAGASHLFSQEFLELVHSRLNDDGVLLLWMNSEFVSADLLRGLAATLLSRFDHVRLYKPEAQVLFFLASSGPLDIERQLAATGRPVLDAYEHYALNGISGPADVIATLLMEEPALRSFAAGAAPITDNRNRMAMESRSRGDGLDEQALTELLANYDPLLERDSWLRHALTDYDLVNVAARLLRTSQLPRLERLAATVDSEDARLLIEAFHENVERGPAVFRDRLAQALLANPNNSQAAYLLLEEQFDALGLGIADELSRQVAANLRGDAAVVLQGWMHLRSNRWAELQQLDEALGRVSSTDLWYPRALELRARWRLQVVQDDGRYLRAAADFVEQALAVTQNSRLFNLRAFIATRAGDTFRYLESAIFVGADVARQLQRSQSGIAPMSREALESAAQVIDSHIARFDDDFVEQAGERGRWAREQLLEVRAALGAELG